MRRILVTQAHIERGKPSNCTECPIALALRDAGVETPRVGKTTVVYGPLFAVTTGALYVPFQGCADLPPAAETFRRDFDRGDPVQPIAFDIAI